VHLSIENQKSVIADFVNKNSAHNFPDIEECEALLQFASKTLPEQTNR